MIRDHKHDRNLGINCFFQSSTQNNAPMTDPVDGIKSIAIPGELKCLQRAYHDYARFYWKTLAAPAINLARNGFTVSSLLGKLSFLNRISTIFTQKLTINNKNEAQNLEKLEKVDFDDNPLMAEMYLSKNGTLVKEGDVIRNPSLADALEKLNRHDYVFYNNGALGQDLVTELTQNEVEQITREDLNEYTEKEDKLTKIEFDG